MRIHSTLKATAIHQIATVTYSINFYAAFCATPCVPLSTEEIIAT